MTVQESPAALMVPPTVRPPVERQRPPRSRLGRLVLSVGALVLGIIAIVDLAGVQVLGSLYLAAPLTVVGLGLVLGAWYGHARWLIAPGVVLTVLLFGVTTAERMGPVGDATWRPTAVQQMDSAYHANSGNAFLDLSAVDFTGQSRAVTVDVGAGNLKVVVPANVDVHVRAKVGVGNANVFGTTWNGIGQGERTISDDGADGPGGGVLTLQTTVNMGNLEVRR